MGEPVKSCKTHFPLVSPVRLTALLVFLTFKLTIVKFQNKYLERLVHEWEQHGKIIIGVDYDSTISPYHTIDNVEDINRCIRLLKDAQLVGCYTIIHTACNEDRHEEIYNYCKKIGIHVDTINETPIGLEYGKKGSKPYCNLFLDDRAGFREAMTLLEEAIYLQRSYKRSQIHLDEIG